jgi:hypothetical protein
MLWEIWGIQPASNLHWAVANQNSENNLLWHKSVIPMSLILQDILVVRKVLKCWNEKYDTAKKERILYCKFI